MTREELLAELARKRSFKLVLNWGHFSGAVSSAPQATKTITVDAINSGNNPLLASTIIELVRAKRLDVARQEVDAVAADDKLSIDELIDILG